jgi:5-methylcytosine-specific restriction endonuclease McrA
MAAHTTFKTCSRCGEEKTTDDFCRNRTKPDGLNAWCRECNRKRSRQYYAENQQRHVRVTVARRKAQSALARRWVIQYLLTHPCVDCGESDIVVLEFDHLADKKKEVSVMINAGYSVKAIQREIEKCEVVCANCHRKRTARRGNYYKLNLGTVANDGLAADL